MDPRRAASIRRAETSLHVRRAAAGESESLAWIVERFTPLLLTQAAFRMGPALRRTHDPEDVVADVWARSLDKLEGISPRNGRLTPVLLAYLSTAVLNRVRSLFHEASRAARDPSLADGATSQGGPGPVNALRTASSVVIEGAARDERCRAIRREIELLGDTDREVLILRGIEQRSNREVAEQLGLKPEVVANRYHRALARLRAALPASIFEELGGS